MKKLNPITALYLKVLEVIAQLMVVIGEAGERVESAQINSRKFRTSQQYRKWLYRRRRHHYF